MTEEQLQRVKDEAEAEAKFAMLFAKPTSEGLQNLGSSAEMLMRISFVNGARFGFRLAKESEAEKIFDGVYKVGGCINDQV